MGPIRGLKRKRKAEKKVDQDVLAAASGPLGSHPQPLDWWEQFSKRISGPLSKIKNSRKFESVLKISRKTFDYICSLVKEDMMSRQSTFTDNSGKPLSLNDQVAVALRRLGSGESLSNIGESFGMNQSTVSQITWRFVEAMEERGLHHLQWPSTEAEMEDIKSKFERIRGLPNCCGAIDITHIVMTLPTMDPSNDVWFDSEKNYSMVLQAIVDPEMRLRDVIVGWPGRDAGFPLLPWLLTPYQGRGLLEFQVEFNKRHSATRMVAQMALTRLKEMWRMIQGVMWMPDKNRLPRIIFVCCLLHNILIDMEDEVLDDMPLSHHHDTVYHQQRSESVDMTASTMRDQLSLYLSGKLPP
ncbi:hypothetical protein SLEP1_g5699 [Rubroshorea leprosula]|uniref:DDE Tnp4 domain-containing protein n=1 Tax=Rubroshorea leprosula TaxID=152421 RepID=A0AAV5I2D6_9ROSI|nr:hypothetical protein SLEP1_g5699 [Rubroshorea leprosula]